MSLKEIKVPDIGDFKEVEIIEILVKEGDTVAAEQSLITVESDKASMEVPASHAGVVTAVKVKLGDKVNEGSEIIEVQSNAADVPAAKQAPAAAVQEDAPAAKAESAAPAAKQQPAPEGGLASVPPERHSPTESFADANVPLRNLPHASPSVRK